MRCLVCAAIRIGLVGLVALADSVDVNSCRVFRPL